MKRIAGCLSIVLLVAAAHAEQNLLSNGDFSNALQLQGWTPFPGSGPVAFSGAMNAGGSASGSIVLSSGDPDGGTGVGSTCFAVAPGAAYRYGGKLSPGNVSGVTSRARMECRYFKNATCSQSGDAGLDEHPVTFTGAAPFQAIPEASGILDGSARSVNCVLLL